MYSDIIPPKKNNIAKIKTVDNEVRILRDEPFLTQKEVYHTAYGRDKKSKLPKILFLITLVVLSIVYYSVFNNKTRILFQSKSTIFEIKDIIPMILSEKNQSASTTLSYNLIYNEENKDRNIFAPIETSLGDEGYFILNSTTTSPANSIKVKLVNETNSNIQVVINTRIDVNGATYYLDRSVDIKKTDSPVTSLASTTNKYRVMGFKGTANYEKFYAVDYVDSSVVVGSDATTTDKNSPNNDILSLIPENYIPLKKNYIYDKNINQTALVVIDKKDFEKVLKVNSRLIQEYIKTFISISDLMEYEISINDYDLELDTQTGLPISFKNLNLEIIPKIKKDKVAPVFKGFSKDTMKKIKNEIAKNIDMNVNYSPFWISQVSDEDHISVEVK